MIRYTPEQADLLDLVKEQNGIVLVEAGAGTGKSFMSRRIVEELKPKSGIYTAFNKAIVEEGVNRFYGTPIECKTFHALAYRYINPKMPIESFTYKCIAEKLTYPEKRKIIDTIDEFFVSSSTCMDDYFDTSFKNHPRSKFMSDTCANYVNKMVEGEVNPTFNFLLKYFHLMLVEKTVEIKIDLLILDEINDVTAVSLEIFKLIDANKKIGLGETHQAIYGFLKLVNGFEELKDVATTLKLTQSYRCSEQIAKRINDKMSSVLDPNFKFVGTDTPVKNGLTLYCTNTNAMIVDAIYERLSVGKSFKLLRKPAEIFAAPLAVLSASQGKKPYQRKYEYLVDLFEDYKAQDKHKNYFKYLQEVLDDDEISNAIRLLMKLKTKNVNLFSIYKEAKEAKQDNSYTIATVFTSKGLEFEEVYIADDLNRHFTDACEGKLDTEAAITAMRCYYVACSRAGNVLKNSIL